MKNGASTKKGATVEPKADAGAKKRFGIKGKAPAPAPRQARTRPRLAVTVLGMDDTDMPMFEDPILNQIAEQAPPKLPARVAEPSETPLDLAWIPPEPTATVTVGTAAPDAEVVPTVPSGDPADLAFLTHDPITAETPLDVALHLAWPAPATDEPTPTEDQTPVETTGQKTESAPTDAPDLADRSTPVAPVEQDDDDARWPSLDLVLARDEDTPEATADPVPSRPTTRPATAKAGKAARSRTVIPATAATATSTTGAIDSAASPARTTAKPERAPSPRRTAASPPTSELATAPTKARTPSKTTAPSRRRPDDSVAAVEATSRPTASAPPARPAAEAVAAPSSKRRKTPQTQNTAAADQVAATTDAPRADVSTTTGDATSTTPSARERVTSKRTRTVLAPPTRTADPAAAETRKPDRNAASPDVTSTPRQTVNSADDWPAPVAKRQPTKPAKSAKAAPPKVTVEPLASPAAETPAPVADVPAPVAETPAPLVTTPAPVAETPAPVAATPAPAAEPPAQSKATPARAPRRRKATPAKAPQTVETPSTPIDSAPDAESTTGPTSSSQGASDDALPGWPTLGEFIGGRTRDAEPEPEAEPVEAFRPYQAVYEANLWKFEAEIPAATTETPAVAAPPPPAPIAAAAPAPEPIAEDPDDDIVFEWSRQPTAEDWLEARIAEAERQLRHVEERTGQHGDLYNARRRDITEAVRQVLGDGELAEHFDMLVAHGRFEFQRRGLGLSPVGLTSVIPERPRSYRW